MCHVYLSYFAGKNFVFHSVCTRHHELVPGSYATESPARPWKFKIETELSTAYHWSSKSNIAVWISPFDSFVCSPPITTNVNSEMNQKYGEVRRAWNVECEMWNVQCKARNAKCKVPSVKCKAWRAQRELQSAKWSEEWSSEREERLAESTSLTRVLLALTLHVVLFVFFSLVFKI